MSYLPRILAVSMSLVPLISPAGTEYEQPPPAPTVELLEFLAEWETDQGTWAGPARFEDDSFDQLYDPDSIENEQDD